MVLYGLKNCDSCRKALKKLGEARFVDVRSDGVPPDLLAAAFAQFGSKMINTRSATWRELAVEERERPPLDLLADHPVLMKRPLIESDGALFLGWDAQTQAGLGVS